MTDQTYITALEIATEHALKNSEQFGCFMCNVHVNREPSEFFGMISVPELQSTMFSARATPDQICAAVKDLRKRYLADCDQDILQDAGKYMEQD